MKTHYVEVCSYSVQSAINAQAGGADRVELCDNFIEGGTTPSYSAIKHARKNLDIDLHVIIRPRGGDFLYSDLEFEIMKEDIAVAKSLGVDGVVFGILKKDGTIDRERMKTLLDMARPMKVTCHRAFDMTKDLFESLQTLTEIGVDIILTSGGLNTAMEGKEFLAELVNEAKGKIVIMPGSGINENNIVDLERVTGASDFHLSAKAFVPGKMEYINNYINMGGNSSKSEYDILETDPAKVRKVVEKLKELSLKMEQ